MASDKIVQLSDDNSEPEVLMSDTPVLVDFWGEGGGPCRRRGLTMNGRSCGPKCMSSNESARFVAARVLTERKREIYPQ